MSLQVANEKPKQTYQREREKTSTIRVKRHLHEYKCIHKGASIESSFKILLTRCKLLVTLKRKMISLSQNI